MSNFINEDDESVEFSKIAKLLELGRQKSYVTIDDILHFFPEAEQDVEQLEEAFAALMSAGIPYIEDETPLDGPSDDDLEPDIKESEEDAYGTMKKEIGDAVPKVKELLKNAILERTNAGDEIIIAGIGNTIGNA